MIKNFSIIAAIGKNHELGKNGGLVNVGNHGHWWSSTVESANNAHNLYAASNSVRPKNFNSRTHGFSVRCIQDIPPTISDISTLQEMKPEYCTNSAIHQTATLTDTRDGERYTVAKLKDGKCWMIQNLRLKLKTDIPLTPADSDVQQNWTPTHSTDTASCAIGVDWAGGDYKAIRSCYQSDATYRTNGVYYTYGVATANTAYDMDTDDTDAPGSICPKGWRLPKSNTDPDSPDNEFYVMSKEYKGNATWTEGTKWSGANNMFLNIPSFTLSGWRDYASVGADGVGTYGLWWSSTIKNNHNAYGLYLESTGVKPRGSNYRHSGFSVRCLAR